MVGLIKHEVYEPCYPQMYEKEEPNRLLSKKLWDEHFISSATFVNYVESPNINNLPIKENPICFSSFEKISVPIFAFMGSEDDIIIYSPLKDLSILTSKAGDLK